MLEKIYYIIESPEDNRAGRYFNIAIVLLIILNVISVILESFQGIYIQYNNYFRIFELLSVIIFTVEYVLRLCTVKYKYPDLNLSKAILKYTFSFMALVDLFAIIPFYLPLMMVVDLRFLRILRLVRIFRILKLSRYTKSLQLLGKVLKNKKEDLVVTLFVMGILLVASSSLMYYIENPAQPDAFPNIVASFWWGVATLTTVGYGDVYPVTFAGKVISGMIAILGIGLVALPTGIISSGFLEEIEKGKKDVKVEVIEDFDYCPHCGKRLR